MRVLVVDDEPAMVEMLGLILRFQWPDCEVLSAGNGAEALEMAANRSPDLVLLDLGLPGSNGYEVLQDLRSVSPVPVIVVSGRSDELDKVRSLELGADDFVVKPFGQMELLARIKAVLRRASTPNSETGASYYDGYLAVDFPTRQVTIGGERLYLTAREFGLLRQLLTSAGRTVPHEVLLAKIWGQDYVDERGYLRVYIRRLREKIEHNPAEPQYLLADRPIGYRFQPSPFARR